MFPVVFAASVATTTTPATPFDFSAAGVQPTDLTCVEEAWPLASLASLYSFSGAQSGSSIDDVSSQGLEPWSFVPPLKDQRSAPCAKRAATTCTTLAT